MSGEGRSLRELGQTISLYVLHEFNAFNGDRTGLYTLRDTNVTINSYADLVAAKPVMDKTTWIFEPATGQLTAKRYADGHGPDYTYHTDSQLATRTWARTDGSGNRIKTTYGYTSGTRQLETTTYSDGTPSVSNAYHQITGLLKSTTDASGLRSYTHTDKLQVLSEIHNGLLTNTLTRAYDLLGRPAGHTLYDASGNSLQTIVRGFDGFGRSASVLTTSHHGPNSPSTNRVDYGYLPDSDLLHSTAHTIPGGSSGVTAHIKNYEPHRNLIDRIDNLHGTNPISIFDYHNDPAGRRTQRLDEDTSGSITTNTFGYNARSELASAQMGPDLSTYEYDPIGNRTSATQFDGSFSYDSNELNQYSSITDDLISEMLDLSYDLDGNMLDINGFTATWNGENRLTTLTKTVGGTTTNLAFTYDAIGRRVRKLVTVNGTITKDINFLYDGWNLLIEHDSAVVETTTYTWGLDLSQSEQGGGGVGGLLSLEGPNRHRRALCDANGNVTDYVDATGSVKVHYEYDGFGNVSVMSEGELPESSYQFSTKYFDSEFKLNYYGFRYYLSSLGRWASRDPLSENAGYNIYRTLSSDVINDVDYLGLCVSLVTPNGRGRGGLLKYKRVRSEGDVSIKRSPVSSRAYGHASVSFHIIPQGSKCSINLVLELTVRADLDDAPLPKGTKIDYHEHFFQSGTDILGGGFTGVTLPGGEKGRPKYTSVLQHEKGHMRSFINNLKPCFEKSVKIYCGKNPSNEDLLEIARIFRECKIQNAKNSAEESNFSERLNADLNGYKRVFPAQLLPLNYGTAPSASTASFSDSWEVE